MRVKGSYGFIAAIAILISMTDRKNRNLALAMLAALCWIDTVCFAAGTASPYQSPQGMVSVMGDSMARAAVEHGVASEFVLVDGFVTKPDAQRLDTGNSWADGRYISIVQFKDPSRKSISQSEFDNLVKVAREGPTVPGIADAVNRDIKERSAKLPSNISNTRMEGFRTGDMFIDSPNCVGRVAVSRWKNPQSDVSILNVTTFQRRQGQLFLVALHVVDNPAGTQWLSNEGSKWLKAVCDA